MSKVTLAIVNNTLFLNKRGALIMYVLYQFKLNLFLNNCIYSLHSIQLHSPMYHCYTYNDTSHKLESIDPY